MSLPQGLALVLCSLLTPTRAHILILRSWRFYLDPLLSILISVAIIRQSYPLCKHAWCLPPLPTYNI